MGRITYNHRIQKLSAQGEPRPSGGASAPNPGQFYQPAGLAVDGQGNVYVADSGNDRIQKLSIADPTPAR